MKKTAYGVILLAPDLSADKDGHEHRSKGDGKKRGKKNAEGFGVGKWRKEPSCLGLQGEDGKKCDSDHEEREKQGRAHFLGSIDDDLNPSLRFKVQVPGSTSDL